MQPLAGITVVALEQAVAAPFATRQLADLGARVIKVERVGSGDFARAYDEAVNGLSSHFVWLNRSKESIAVDLKDPRGPRIIEQLLDTADVFVHNLAPGAVDRLGLAPDALRVRRPSLISCAISGYGSSGPYRLRKAYDLLIQAETGVLAVTGTPVTPAKAGIAIADIAGGMYAFSGILAALLQRSSTGEGAALDIALFDALAEWMGFPMYYGLESGVQPPRSGAAHATIAPYGPFRLGDGSDVVIAIQNDREWVSFCEHVLEEAGLATDERYATNPLRVTNREALEHRITQSLARLGQEQAAALLDAAQIAYGQMRLPHDLVTHPQVTGRGRLTSFGSPVGPIAALPSPANPFPDTAPFGPIPEVGQHSRSILSELGYAETEIDDLIADAVVGSPG
jgi:itaconate CoA-transferase